MTTAEMHENALRNVPFKYGQRVYFLNLHDVVCGTIDCIDIKLSSGEPEFEFRVKCVSPSGTVSYEKVYHGDVSKLNTDPMPLLEKWLLNKLSSLDGDKRRYENYLKENESQRKAIYLQYESLKKQFCP